MAYTAVKLADVQKAIAAVTAAQKKYTDAQASTKSSQTAVTNAQKALDTARTKLESLQAAFDDQSYLTKNSGYTNAQKASTAAEKKLNDARAFLDSGQFLEKNSSYQNSLKAITTAEKNRDAAQARLDAATDKNRASLERALTSANRAVETAYTNSDKARQAAEKAAQTSITAAEKTYNTSMTALDNARAAAERAYQNGTIKPAQAAFDKANTAFDTAQNKYQAVMDSIQPLVDQRNEAINNVGSYIDNIRGSLGDVTKFADAKSVQTLLGQIQTAVKNTKLDDLIKPVTSMISEIDPLKMANIPTVNLPKANPDYFTNIDQSTGLPLLDQGALDSVLNKYNTNTLNKDQYRDNYNKFGWNVKSDGSSVARGAAIFGLEKTQAYGGGVSYTGDFKKAAEQAGVDISGLKTNEEKYNAINDATKDFYVVANALDRTSAGANQKAPHAAILFKADGSGNLVPVTKPNGQLAANYFDAVGVSHAGWRGQLAELAPVIQIASLVFAPQLGQALSSALSGIQVGTAAAVAPTAFTVGAPATAITLGQVVGQTGISALTSSIMNGGMAALTGGDVSKAMQAGLVSGAVSANTSDIAKTVMGGGATGEANIKELARISNLSVDQTEKIIASGVTSGLASTISDPSNIGENIAYSIVGNFASEEAKNFITGRIDPKSLNGLETFASNAAGVAATAAARGDDVVKALENAGKSLAINAARAQKNYVPPVGSGASGFPIQKEIENYYEELLASDFDENVVSQIKQIFPNISDDDAVEMAKSFTGDIAAKQIAQSIGDTSEGTLDYLRSSIAGTGSSFQTYGIPKNISQIQELNPLESESGGGIRKVVDKEGIVSYEQTIFGKTKDGKDYSYVATYDPDAPEGKKIRYEVRDGIAVDEKAQAGSLPPAFVTASLSRPDFTQEGAPGAFSAPEIKTTGTGYNNPYQSNVIESLVGDFSQNAEVMTHYIQEANKILAGSGIASPSQEDLNKTALSLLQIDVGQLFAPSGTTGAGGTTGGAGTAGGIFGGTTGVAGEGGAGTSGTGTGIAGTGGVGTGGTGAGGTGGGDGTGDAAAQKAAQAALQKRQQTYKALMGIAALPAIQQAEAKTSGPSEAFYYGKEFNAPTQQIGSKGELIQQQYQPLSVTMPGKEPEFLKARQVVPGEKTDENDISSLIGLGEDIDLNELIDILGRGTYGI